MGEVKYKTIDVEVEIAKAPLEPYADRVLVIEREVESVGLIEVPKSSRDSEMKTNMGYVVAVGDSADWCSPGDLVYYGKYSGAWVSFGDKRYRIMNEDDLLGKVR